jgi:ABC-type transport system involved in multi-copper enzyme maturation permease subunit
MTHTAVNPAALANGTGPTHRPIPFGKLLRVEWRKSVDTRAARWCLGVVALLTCAAPTLPLFLPKQFEQTTLSYLFPTAVVLALLLPLVSILALTSEWGQRSVLVTFTQEPRRARVVAAKLLSGAALALVGSAVAIAASAGALAISAALGRSVVWNLEWKYAVGFVAFVLVNSLMGMAFGALLLNTPAAIVLFLALPTIWTLISYGVLEDIGRWLDTAQTFRHVLEADWDGHTGPIVVSLAVWVAAPLALGIVRTLRREVA